MIKLTPVITSRLAPGETQDDYQRFIIEANEPVTIEVCLIPLLNTKHKGIHAFVYRGMVDDNMDDDTEPVFVFDGSIGFDENEEIEVA